MSKILYQTPFLDAAKAAIDRVFIVDVVPADYAAAVAAALVTGVLVPTDFTIAAGDVSGKKITFGGKSGLTAGATGNFNHAVFASSGSTTIWAITDGATNSITTNDTVNIGAVDILEIQDPV